MISELCHCSNPSTPLEESRCKLEISSKVASRSMGRDRDANHEVSGREGDRDADFTQPRLGTITITIYITIDITTRHVVS